jgi:hypothetical protein
MLAANPDELAEISCPWVRRGADSLKETGACAVDNSSEHYDHLFLWPSKHDQGSAMSQPSSDVDRIRLGENPRTRKSISGNLPAALGVTPLIVLGVLARSLSVTLIGIGLVCLMVWNWWARAPVRPVTEAPATLTDYGFSLRVNGGRAHVPWDDVTDVRVYQQSYRSWWGPHDVVTSLVAYLDSESKYRRNPVVTLYRDLLGSDWIGDSPVWLGEITTASVPMDTVLTTVRGWVGSRLDSTPESHRPLDGPY